MKRILVGLVAIILGSWTLSGLYALAATSGDSGDAWEWYHTLMVVPFIAIGVGIVLVILWGIGDKILGDS